ncbi:MAG: efflux RND transporter permease subunit [Pseudomonadota bacterium]|nr:efflux RND transporter permease subunit [Sphingomonas sp.]MDQ3478351.1 efflux RND transporter permease subunit [Pseudomonadota bacterium]
MNFRNISSWCIQNPVPPIVLFIGLLLAGVVAFMRMDVTGNPDIDFPAASVSVSQPGAAPAEMENQITQRVESAIRGVDGVDEINSSVREGYSETFVQFRIGTPTDRAVTDVRDAIAQIRGDLPDGILEPQVQRANIGGSEIAFIAGETTDMSLEQLSWYIDNTVARRLLGQPGVAAVTREGGVDRQIRVILNPAALMAHGITAAQVNAQLRQTNLNAAGGRAEIAGSEQSVRVLGNAGSAFDLSQTQISATGGRVVRLAELGEVQDSYAETRSAAVLGDRQVVSFNIQRAKGESDLVVYEHVWNELRQIEKDDPRIKFVEIDNSVEYMKAQYESSMHALIEGAILAVLVVFLFLKDLRATLISAVAIPLSAIPAFWFMDLMGINLNFLSLLALALVAGVLVDDAIVEIENIVRHMRMGKSAYQASFDAADEIGLAVLATTMAIVAVFLPVALMPGISGQFFKNFGYTVVVAVMMSLLVARMITPLMAAYFLKAHGEEPHASGKWMMRYLAMLKWTLSTGKVKALLDRLPTVPGRGVYYLIETVLIVVMIALFAIATMAARSALTAAGLSGIVALLAALVAGAVAVYLGFKLVGALVQIKGGHFAAWHPVYVARSKARLRDHRLGMVLVGLGTLILTGVLFSMLSMTFEPEQDVDNSRVRIQMAPGTTHAQTREIAARTADVIEQHPDVEAVFQRVFTSVGFVNVMYKDDRSKPSFDIEREITPQLAKIADAQVNFLSQSGGGPGGASRDINIFLGSADPIKLEDAANKLADEMGSLSELVAPRVVGDNVRPEIIVTPRFDLAADLGVTTSALSQTIRIATIGDIAQNSAKFSLADRQVPISVSLSENSRRDLATLENLPVPTANGGSVPLKSVASIGFGSGPVTVQRTNQVRRISIGADLAPGLVSSDAYQKIDELPTMKNLPEGVTRLTLGSQKWQGELVQNFIVAVIAGVLLVFAVLVLLYRRFLAPLVNMGSLLLAPLGAAIALHIAGAPVSLPVFIGLLMLLGIVAKNSILLVDFAVEMMNHGMDKDEAIYEAGHKRAQPIVMTTVAMVAGMLPTALSLSGDSSWRAPMGITVIGGLIFSTILTLVLVPAYFSIAIDIESWIGRKLGRLVIVGEDHSARPDAAPLPAE